jgi:flagellar FliJ protein
MAFHFRLETLLRYRRNVEEREWLKVQGLSEKLANVRGEIDCLQQCALREKSLFADAKISGVNASELHFARKCQGSRRQLQSALEERLLELTAEYEAQKSVFLEARKDRDVIERLREGQHAAYMRDEARREQSEADQMFLLRRELQRQALPSALGSICRVPIDLDVEKG